MRMRHWSSDVCSSDLDRGRAFNGECCHRRESVIGRGYCPIGPPRPVRCIRKAGSRKELHHDSTQPAPGGAPHGRYAVRGEGFRSAEHTSELQSLMRTSYAVFCWKKKKNTDHRTSI